MFEKTIVSLIVRKAPFPSSHRIWIFLTIKENQLWTLSGRSVGKESHQFSSPRKSWEMNPQESSSNENSSLLPNVPLKKKNNKNFVADIINHIFNG